MLAHGWICPVDDGKGGQGEIEIEVFNTYVANVSANCPTVPSDFQVAYLVVRCRW